MKSISLITASLLIFSAALTAGTKPKLSTPALAFTENKGQVHDQYGNPRTDVLYGVSTGNLAVHIRNNGISYQLYRLDKMKETVDPLRGEKRTEIAQQTIYRVDMQWQSCNKQRVSVPDKTLPGHSNYYSESCPNGALNVKSYSGVTLLNLYSGINLHYYENLGELKHDYIVAPHADYKQIRLELSGADVTVKTDGSVLLRTPLGTIQEGAPLVFQNGKQLKAKWQIENNVLSFDIQNYNPNYELIIDPVTRIWGTYYGGVGVLNGFDTGDCSATDASGNVYLCGSTVITGTIIATLGTHQSSLAGSNDAYLAKFDATGTRMWGTFYGGSDTETGVSCAPDASGNVYLTGLTRSTAAIATSGVYQSTHSSGSNYDGYLVKFNSNGGRLWGSYFGGSSFEFPSACAVASDGVYVSGMTDYSTSGIFSNGIHQPTHGGGSGEAFLVKFNTTNGTQHWGTYYGGPGDDRGFSCATDAFGNVYLSGYTTATVSNVIATPGSHQPAIAGTSSAYLVKFYPSGVRDWATYYGNNGEWGLDCTTDAAGNIYMAGNTYTSSSGGTVIATPGTHQTLVGGGQDAYIVKFNIFGVRQWGTYFGGAGNEYCYSCAVDVSGNVYLGGTTTSTNSSAMATAASHQTAYAGGTADAFFTKLSANGTWLDGTYFGGAGDEYGGFLSLSATGYLYAAGRTGSSNGTEIATPGSHQPIFGGTPYDEYLVKFDLCQGSPQLPAINGATTACIGVSYTYSTPLVAGAHSYTWAVPLGFTSTGGGTYSISATANTSGVFSLSTENTCGISTQTLNVPVFANPVVSVNNGTLCSGKSFTLLPSGAATYAFPNGGPIVFPPASGAYTVVGTSTDGCSTIAVSNLTVIASPVLTVASGSVCVGQSFTFVPAGASTYSYTEGPVVTPSVSSNYTVTGTGNGGCSSSAVVNVAVSPLPNVSPVSSNAILCAGESATLSAIGIVSVTTLPQGQGGGIVSPTVTTTYTVYGSDAKGCLNTAVFTQSVDACTGLRENEKADFIKLYPNPVKDVLYFEADRACQLSVYNSLGQVLSTVQLNFGAHAITLNGLASGIYLIKVDAASKQSAYRVVKE